MSTSVNYANQVFGLVVEPVSNQISSISKTYPSLSPPVEVLISSPTYLIEPSLTDPIATVQKIVTEILPPSSGLAFGKDARDLLIECCVEFITLISSEANEISEKESKKTIACEHITKALEQLGFGEYVGSIMEVASEHKEQLKVRSKTHHPPLPRMAEVGFS